MDCAAQTTLIALAEGAGNGAAFLLFLSLFYFYDEKRQVRNHARLMAVIAKNGNDAQES